MGIYRILRYAGYNGLGKWTYILISFFAFIFYVFHGRLVVYSPSSGTFRILRWISELD